jgi:hypothetical protein
MMARRRPRTVGAKQPDATRARDAVGPNQISIAGVMPVA